MLPAHIITMYEQAGSGSGSRRAEQSRIINELFNRDEAGSLVMKAEKPVFRAFKDMNFNTTFCMIYFTVLVVWS